MKKAQADVALFLERNDMRADPTSRLLDLVSEVGELAKEVLNSSRYGREPFKAGAGWSGELGDLTFSLLGLADATHVDLEAALAAALAKYQLRLQTCGDASSGSIPD